MSRHRRARKPTRAPAPEAEPPAGAPPRPDRRARLRRAGQIALLFAVVAVGYWPAIDGGFIWDDTVLLSEAPLVHAPDGLRRFWLTTEAPDYWPLTNTTFWLEWRLWGTNTTGYHATNLLLHAVEAVLVWALLARLAIPGAYLAALLFAVHPVNVESVAWIAQRKNLVALLFFLPSLLFYFVGEDERKAGRRSRRFYAASFACFVLAMLGKGSVATLPVILLLLVWWRERRLARADVVRVLPFFVVGAALVLVNIWFQTHGTGPIRDASLAERVAGAGAVVWFYLGKALLPVRLAFVYPQWTIEAARLVWWIPLVAAAAVTGVLFLRRGAWARPFFVAWACFCVALLPVMGLTDVYFMKYSLVADHYQHVAIIAVLALVSAGWAAWHRAARGGLRWAAVALATLAVGTLTHLTARQSALYESAETIYRATLELNPECWLAHYNLAVELGKGREDEAFALLQRAVRAEPGFADAHNNLALALQEKGLDEEAFAHAQAAVRLKPDLAQARVNLGQMLAKRGRHAEALAHLEEAVRLQPASAEARHNLGLTLKALGRGREGMEQLVEAVRLDPGRADAHNAAGTGLLEAGEVDGAIQAFEHALALEPDSREARANLGQALVRAGRPEEALLQYQEAARLWPDSAEVHYNLATLLVGSGRGAEGLRHYERALELRPSYAKAHNNLAAALVDEGRVSEAIPHLEEAVRLEPDFVEARVNLAQTFARAGRFAEAVDQARAALPLVPAAQRPALEQRIEAWRALSRR